MEKLYKPDYCSIKRIERKKEKFIIKSVAGEEIGMESIFVFSRTNFFKCTEKIKFYIFDFDFEINTIKSMSNEFPFIIEEEVVTLDLKIGINEVKTNKPKGYTINYCLMLQESPRISWNSSMTYLKFLQTTLLIVQTETLLI